MKDSNKYRGHQGLTAEQVGEIKARILLGEKQTVIARYYGVGVGAIYKIKSGESWKDIQPTQAPKDI